MCCKLVILLKQYNIEKIKLELKKKLKLFILLLNSKHHQFENTTPINLCSKKRILFHKFLLFVKTLSKYFILRKKRPFKKCNLKTQMQKRKEDNEDQSDSILYLEIVLDLFCLVKSVHLYPNSLKIIKIPLWSSSKNPFLSFPQSTCQSFENGHWTKLQYKADHWSKVKIRSHNLLLNEGWKRKL